MTRKQINLFKKRAAAYIADQRGCSIGQVVLNCWRMKNGGYHINYWYPTNERSKPIDEDVMERLFDLIEKGREL